MKWIRRGLVVLASLPILTVGILLLVGQRRSAGRTEAQVLIDRLCAEAFEHVQDPERLRRWTGLKVLRPLSPLPLKKGSRFQTVTLRRGQSTEAVGEVMDFSPNDRIVFEVHSAERGPARFSQTAVYRFQEENGRCRVAVSAQTRFAWLLQLVEPLVTPVIQEELERLLRAMKTQVESESSLIDPRPPNPAPQRP